MSVMEYVPNPGESCKNQFKMVLGEILMGLVGVNHSGITQEKLGIILGCTNTRISNLYNGHYASFSCDWLYERVCMLGYVPKVTFDTNKGWHGGTLEIDFRNKGEQYTLPIPEEKLHVDE